MLYRSVIEPMLVSFNNILTAAPLLHRFTTENSGERGCFVYERGRLSLGDCRVSRTRSTVNPAVHALGPPECGSVAGPACTETPLGTGFQSLSFGPSYPQPCDRLRYLQASRVESAASVRPTLNMNKCILSGNCGPVNVLIEGAVDGELRYEVEEMPQTEALQPEEPVHRKEEPMAIEKD